MGATLFPPAFAGTSGGTPVWPKAEGGQPGEGVWAEAARPGGGRPGGAKRRQLAGRPEAGGPAGAGSSPGAPRGAGPTQGAPQGGCHPAASGAGQTSCSPAGGGSPVPDLGQGRSAGRAQPPPSRLLGSRTVHRVAALPPLSQQRGHRTARAPPGLARHLRAASGAGVGRWRPQTAGWATRGRKEGGWRWGWGGEGTSCLLGAHRRQRRAPAAQTARRARSTGCAPGGWGRDRPARAQRLGGGALRSYNRPDDGARVPEELGDARRRPQGPMCARARCRRWLRSSSLPLRAALALPRAAGDGGGVCGKPCVSAVTWAGRGLGDVRGLCVAMCVGFGAAPAQLKGAGERRRRRRAQVRSRLAGRGTRLRRREAGGARPSRSPTAKAGVAGN